MKKRNANGTYSDIVPGVSVGAQLYANFADTYSTQKAYAVGEYCIYEDILYQCKYAMSSGEAWNAAHWNVVTVGDELIDKVDKVSGKGLSANDYTNADKALLQALSGLLTAGNNGKAVGIVNGAFAAVEIPNYSSWQGGNY